MYFIHENTSLSGDMRINTDDLSELCHGGTNCVARPALGTMEGEAISFFCRGHIS